jgi:hypothetical protein
MGLPILFPLHRSLTPFDSRYLSIAPEMMVHTRCILYLPRRFHQSQVTLHRQEPTSWLISGSQNVFSSTSRAKSRVSANCLQESLIFKVLSARMISVYTRAMEKQSRIVHSATVGEQSQSSSVFNSIGFQELSKMQSRLHVVCL